MALNTTALESTLTTLFSNPPNSFSGCAAQWATAMRLYAQSIVPASVTVTVAADTLQTALTGIFTASNSQLTATQMDAAFAQFATFIAIGMGPAFTGTPPVSPVNFALLFVTAETTTEAAVDKVVNRIDTWMRTGTAVQTTTPFATVTWS